jgi:predicted peptidase
VFSNTQERFWLKLAGAYLFVIGAILVSILVANMYSPIAQANIILQKIGQWATIAVGLVPVLYMMNFVNEIKILKAESTNTLKQKHSENILGFAAIIAFLVTATLGALFINDGYLKSYWQKYSAEQAQQLIKLAGGAHTFVDSKNDSLHYILIKPQGYDASKKYPLVVCLPYGGYVAPAAELLTTGLNRRTYPVFIFVPYCAEGTGWGGIPGVLDRDLLVYETITSLAEPAIDVKRRYVTGVSRGGYGTWQFICTRPDMFAAAIPVCGGGDPKLASKITKIPIWAFHGAKDKNVPVSGSREIIAAIKKAGGHPKYTEFPNESHDIWNEVSKTPGLLDWLFAQRRE